MTILVADINVLLKFPTIAVTFYLLFSVAGLIFCVINSVINLLLFYNQSKVRRRDIGGRLGVNILLRAPCAYGLSFSLAYCVPAR